MRTSGGEDGPAAYTAQTKGIAGGELLVVAVRAHCLVVSAQRGKVRISEAAATDEAHTHSQMPLSLVPWPPRYSCSYNVHLSASLFIRTLIVSASFATLDAVD